MKWEIFFSKYANKYCLGMSFTEKEACTFKDYLNIDRGLQNSDFKVLVNEETEKFEKDYYFIITNCNQKRLFYLFNEMIEEGLFKEL